MTKKTKSDDSPEVHKISKEQAHSLKERIADVEGLSAEDKSSVIGLIDFVFLLNHTLSQAKTTLARLKKWLGFKSEKKNKKSSADKDESGDASSEQDGTDQDDSEVDTQSDKALSKPQENEQTPNWQEDENHGRLSAKDYTGCEQHDVKFTDDNPPICPKCDEADSVYKDSEGPRHIVMLEASPIITGKHFVIDLYRCAICQNRIVPDEAKELEEKPKYQASCYAGLAINHYYAGLPFKRIEMLQAASGVPLPDATQYDLIADFYEQPIKPIYAELIRLGMQSTIFHFDDTTQRVLKVTSHNNTLSQGQKKLHVHATAFTAEYEQHQIALYQTSLITAGSEFRELLLAHRESEQQFLTMSDALPSNFTGDELPDDLISQWVICLCLAHGRRKFHELLTVFPEECQLVLDVLGEVYRHDKHCKDSGYTDAQRLSYHQAHSASLMKSLRTWLNNQLAYKQVEPNSSLGQAITYLLKRWHHFTQFLRVLGAPLDNNICEISIKVIIRYRNNSKQYHNLNGAQIGDAMMSVIHTARINGVNIFHYMTALRTHHELASANPHQWLPWNYQETLAEIETTELAA